MHALASWCRRQLLTLHSIHCPGLHATLANKHLPSNRLNLALLHTHLWKNWRTDLILALGAGTSHKTVCQKLAGSLTVQLLYGLLHQLPCPVQCIEYALQQAPWCVYNTHTAYSEEQSTRAPELPHIAATSEDVRLETMYTAMQPVHSNITIEKMQSPC